MIAVIGSHAPRNVGPSGDGPFKHFDNVKTFDGRNAWVAEAWRPLPLMELTGGNFDGAQLEGLTSFPAGIRAAFARWHEFFDLVGEENQADLIVIADSGKGEH